MESLARALGSRPNWTPRVDASPLVGGAAIVFAIGLAMANWQAADRSGDRSADVFVDTVFEAIPENAAILSQWDASTPMWHARYVLDQRLDVLIVDDTNIVYEGWGTRERRVADLICERPVFILRLRDADLGPTRAAFRLEPFLTVRVAAGGPSAAIDRPVFKVEPIDPSSCAGP
jgi:hypothetical protein